MSTLPPEEESSSQQSDPRFVREWLQTHHQKQLGILDRFLMELRLGRISRTSPSRDSDNMLHVEDRRIAVRKTVELIRHIVGATRWKSPAELLSLLRGLGRELHAAGGSREPAIGNVVRRTMAIVREEASREAEDDMKLAGNTNSAETTGRRLSLQTMLWALPQHVKLSRSMSGNDRRDSFASEADMESNYPSIYYTSRPNLKQSVLEAIEEVILSDLLDLHKSINEQATSHIHSGEIMLVHGRSKTVELFLKAAAAKKRNFQVIVCEGAPGNTGRDMARVLKESDIEAILIPDSAAFAVMPRVNKVLLASHAVLANGGLVSHSGCNLVAMAAKHHSVPVVCVTGMFKLCPMYPHEGQDTLNDLISPSSVIDYSELSNHLMAEVEFINPIHDYIQPEHVSLYVTNVGSFQPSFIYRLLAEYYHTDDWESFE